MSTGTTPNQNVERLASPQPLGERALDLATVEPLDGAGGQRVVGVTGARHFFRHFAEMFLAMMVGMMVLGGLDSAILSAAGTSVSHVRDSAPEAFALVMALNMTIGMTLWMRYRRHSWAMCAEMGGAMFLPAIAALILFWCSAIHTKSVGGVEMGTMVPAMLGVMLFRLTEYSQPPSTHMVERDRPRRKPGHGATVLEVPRPGSHAERRRAADGHSVTNATQGGRHVQEHGGHRPGY